MIQPIRLFPELELWLREATRNLVPSAAASVREEISGHFDDAIKNHIAEGLAEPAAITLALRDLGSPKRANRRLRKEWLTESEFLVLSEAARRHAKLHQASLQKHQAYQRFVRSSVRCSKLLCIAALFWRSSRLSPSTGMLLAFYFATAALFRTARDSFWTPRLIGSFDIFLLEEILKKISLSILALLYLAAMILSGLLDHGASLHPGSWTPMTSIMLINMAFVLVCAASSKWCFDLSLVDAWLKYRRIRANSGPAFEFCSKPDRAQP